MTVSDILSDIRSAESRHNPSSGSEELQRQIFGLAMKGITAEGAHPRLVAIALESGIGHQSIVALGAIAASDQFPIEVKVQALDAALAGLDDNWPKQYAEKLSNYAILGEHIGSSLEFDGVRQRLVSAIEAGIQADPKAAYQLVNFTFHKPAEPRPPAEPHHRIARRLQIEKDLKRGIIFSTTISTSGSPGDTYEQDSAYDRALTKYDEAMAAWRRLPARGLSASNPAHQVAQAAYQQQQIQLRLQQEQSAREEVESRPQRYLEALATYKRGLDWDRHSTSQERAAIEANYKKAHVIIVTLHEQVPPEIRDENRCLYAAKAIANSREAKEAEGYHAKFGGHPIEDILPQARAIVAAAQAREREQEQVREQEAAILWATKGRAETFTRHQETVRKYLPGNRANEVDPSTARAAADFMIKNYSFVAEADVLPTVLRKAAMAVLESWPSHDARQEANGVLYVANKRIATQYDEDRARDIEAARPKAPPPAPPQAAVPERAPAQTTAASASGMQGGVIPADYNIMDDLAPTQQQQPSLEEVLLKNNLEKRLGNISEIVSHTDANGSVTAYTLVIEDRLTERTLLGLGLNPTEVQQSVVGGYNRLTITAAAVEANDWTGFSPRFEPYGQQKQQTQQQQAKTAGSAQAQDQARWLAERNAWPTQASSGRAAGLNGLKSAAATASSSGNPSSPPPGQQATKQAGTTPPPKATHFRL